MKILILGATSAIAQETAKFLANDGAELFLVARKKEKLAIVGADLKVRGARRVEEFPMDLCQLELHPQLVNTALLNLGKLDAVLIAFGSLGNQELCESSVEETIKEITTNCLSVISLLTILANYFEKQRSGCIAVISSVAGDRGRKSNYVYGTAKGAVGIFLQGLRNRLSACGVDVVTLKPGFVDTPMTAAIPKNLLFADPYSVGRRIYQAMIKPKDVVYIPWFWRPIMTLLKAIPEPLFKKLKI